MIELPHFIDITIDDYIKEIEASLRNKNYLSALAVALMIPDICQKKCGKNIGYVEWFNKYVFDSFYNFNKLLNKENNIEEKKQYQIELNGNVCYSLRNAILHSGTSYIEYTKNDQKKKAKVDNVNLCLNSMPYGNIQGGDAILTIHQNNGIKKVTIRINIINLIENIIKGYNDFKKDYGSLFLFSMIDFGRTDKLEILKKDK